MIINRVWAMPNKWTFQIPPIKALVDRYCDGGKGWADPFAGMNSPAEFTNDIDSDRPAKYHLDALEFLAQVKGQYRGVLFDPPYSTEQCLRKYTPIQGGTAGRAEYWAKCKDAIAQKIEPGGIVLSFCWDSTGMGQNRGFEIIEILLVCHGACHNDTIVTVERKVQGGMVLVPTPESECLNSDTKAQQITMV